MMQERRHDDRGTLQATVEYYGTRGVACHEVEDASLGGMRLLLSGPEQPGQQVLLRVRFESTEEDGFDATGRIIWARQVAPYVVGVEFDDPDALRNSLLRRYVYN